MNKQNDEGMPEIDTRDFEEGLQTFRSEQEVMYFPQRRPEFIKLVHRLILELGLQNQIEYLDVRYPLGDGPEERAVMYRDERTNPWPSKRMILEIYGDRYMDERLLRHELGHEADRRNPDMHYEPAIEKRWAGRWELHLAMNISLDARLGEQGLGKEFRWEREFLPRVGAHYRSLFEEIWASPPKTWPEMEALATYFTQLKTNCPS